MANIENVIFVDFKKIKKNKNPSLQRRLIRKFDEYFVPSSLIRQEAKEENPCALNYTIAAFSEAVRLGIYGLLAYAIADYLTK